MEVILLSKINKLGNIGSLINVKSGYARNFLIPQGKAIIANKKNIVSFETQQLKLKKEHDNQLMKAKLRAEKIREIKNITIFSRSGKSGKIFGSISARNIVEEIILLGFKIHKKEIRLPNGLLRKIGSHEVIFQPHNEVHEKFIVNIVEKK